MGSFAGSHHDYLLSGQRHQRRRGVNRALYVLDRSQYHPVVFRSSDGLLISNILYTKRTSGAIDLSEPEDNVSPDSC